MFRLENWDEIHEDSYKLIYEQAKVRFEEFASESESITNKSIKILTAIISIAAFFIAYCISNKLNLYNGIVLVLIIIAYSFGLYNLYLLTSSLKQIAYRGVDPSVAAQKTIFVEENKRHQVQGMYYNLIAVISDNIDFMFTKNNDRGKMYNKALIMLYAIIFLTGLYIGFTYYRP